MTKKQSQGLIPIIDMSIYVTWQSKLTRSLQNGGMKKRKTSQNSSFVRNVVQYGTGRMAKLVWAKRKNAKCFDA